MSRRLMTLPPTIELHVTCPSHADVSSLIFCIEVQSGTKNRYHIFFPKTDERGRAQITSDDFQGQFNDHGDVFLMDYNGTIEGASDLVAIHLHDCKRMEAARTDLLRFPLSSRERARWSSRREFLDYFVSARNHLFTFTPQSLQLPPDGTLHATVTPNVP